MKFLIFIKKPLFYFNKAWDLCDEIATELNISKFSLMIDFLYSTIKYNVSIRQYFKSDFYKKSKFERKNIITFPWYQAMRSDNNDVNYIHYLEKKNHFNEFFSEFVGRDWLLLGKEENSATFDDFKQFVNKNKSFIVKPTNMLKGQGVRIIDNITNLELCYTELSQNCCLIEEIIHQNQKLCFGKAVNTVRVYTIVNSKGNANILKCVLRVGVGNNIVDNYAAGGCVYQVDNELGIIISKGISKEKDDHILHPGTEHIMLGYKIPNWELVKTTCIQAAEQLPQVRYIGWDVAITEKGCVLIEGNHDPDYEFLEFVGDRGYKSRIISLLK